MPTIQQSLIQIPFFSRWRNQRKSKPIVARKPKLQTKTVLSNDPDVISMFASSSVRILPTASKSEIASMFASCTIKIVQPETATPKPATTKSIVPYRAPSSDENTTLGFIIGDETIACGLQELSPTLAENFRTFGEKFNAAFDDLNQIVLENDTSANDPHPATTESNVPYWEKFSEENKNLGDMIGDEIIACRLKELSPTVAATFEQVGENLNSALCELDGIFLKKCNPEPPTTIVPYQDPSFHNNTTLGCIIGDDSLARDFQEFSPTVAETFRQFGEQMKSAIDDFENIFSAIDDLEKNFLQNDTSTSEFIDSSTGTINEMA